MRGRKDGKARWHARPLFWICVILGAGAAAGYMTQPEGRRSTGVLRSTLRTTPDGIAAVSRAIERLGRHTAPRHTPFADADPVRGTIAMIETRAIPSPRETDALLARVRSGGTLIYVPPVQRLAPGLSSPVTSPLMIGLGVWFLGPSLPDSTELRWSGHPLTEGLPVPDSLRFGFSPIPWEELADSMFNETTSDPARGPGETDGEAAREPDPEADSVAREARIQEGLDSLETLLERGGIPDIGDAEPMEPLLTSTDSIGREWARAALFQVGEGRILVLAEAEPLANGAAGDSPMAVLAVRAALAYTDEADTVFFDEFHQGVNSSRSRAQVAADFFLGSPGGLALFHVVLVCFLFLACKGLRFGVPNTAVAPADRERRSPLEHVSALGDLYREAGASSTAALLLLSPLATAARRPPPRDLEEAERLIDEIEARGGGHPALDRVREGITARPADLTLVAAGVDEQLARRFNK